MFEYFSDLRQEMAVSQPTEKVKTPEKDLIIKKEKVDSTGPPRLSTQTDWPKKIATNIKTPLKPNCKCLFPHLV